MFELQNMYHADILWNSQLVNVKWQFSNTFSSRITSNGKQNLQYQKLPFVHWTFVCRHSITTILGIFSISTKLPTKCVNIPNFKAPYMLEYTGLSCLGSDRKEKLDMFFAPITHLDLFFLLTVLLLPNGITYLLLRFCSRLEEVE